MQKIIETKNSILERKQFQKYFQTLLLLNESTDDYLFLNDLNTGKAYFCGNISEHFALEIEQDGGVSSQAWSDIVYSRDEAALKKDMEAIKRGEKDVHNMVYRLIDREGKKIWISCRGKVVRPDKDMAIMIGRVSDSALRGKVDSLTGFMNTSKLLEDIEDSVKEGKKSCLFILGVDNFKNINKKYGRSFGNQLLNKIAELLEERVEDEFLIYRLDGDRFAINFVEYDQEMVLEVYRDIQKHMVNNCTFSAGAVEYPIADVEDGNTIYLYAESSLDRAKKEGKNRLCFFSISEYEKQLYVIDLTEEMRRSIQNNFKGFSLVYQPQISLGTYNVVGAEALLRYYSSYHGSVSPDVFINILEHDGTIIPVGKWVFREAIVQCKKWRQNNPEFRMSINISYVQLQQRDLSDYIFRLLDEAQIPGEAIILELTESRQLQNFPKFNQLFYEWERKGIQISVDDFGTGYSSLSYLKSLAVDEIKIDRCFISGIQSSAYNYQLLRNMMELADSAQIRICCEGVEKIEELKTLEELNPELIQGFYFSRPLPSWEFERKFIQNHRAEEMWKSEIGMKSEDRRKNSSIPFSEMDYPKTFGQIPLKDAIIEAFSILLETSEIQQMVPRLLKCISRFYKSEKAYLYFYFKEDDSWCNVYEWCNYETGTRRVNLNSVSGRQLIAWMNFFSGSESLVIKDTDVYKSVNPEIWEIWNERNIYRIIVTPVIRKDNVFCFIGVDNPQEMICDDRLLEEITLHLSATFLDRGIVGTKEDFVSLLSSAMKEEDILKATKLGLWTIEIDTNTNKKRMYVDASMSNILGVTDILTSEGYYNHWYDNINDGYYNYVNNAVEKLIDTGQIIELEYTWNHPKFGEVPVRCVGVLSKIENGVIILKGYHRIVSDMVQVRFLDSQNYEMFEYNEIKHTIYFHTNRAIIQGEEGRETDFPDCWIRQGMIHTYFIKDFREVFNSVKDSQEMQTLDLLMKSKSGEFEWFRLETHHIGSSEQDMNTIIISLHPIMENQTLQLQYVRKDDFYHAILSTTAAYAEVDLNTGAMQSSGGFWEEYTQIGKKEGLNFQQLNEKYMLPFVVPEDYELCKKLTNIENMRQAYRTGRHTANYQHQRICEDHSKRWMELVIHIFQEQVTENMYALVYLKDIDAQKRMQLEREEEASKDPLTNVLNRRMFEHRIAQYVHSDVPGEEPCALLIFDVDNFKQVNDTFGHHKGDEVLKQFASTLQSSFPGNEYVGRLGGDEFIVFIRNFESEEMLNQKLKQFSEKLIKDIIIPINCSVGIHQTRKKDFDYIGSINRADAALYDSKRRGKNTFTYWKH